MALLVASLLFVGGALVGCVPTSLPGSENVDLVPGVDARTVSSIESFLASATPSSTDGEPDPAGTHRVVLFEPVAVADTAQGRGRHVYGDVLDQRWGLGVSGVTELGGSAYPVRILLREHGGVLTPVSFQAPREGTYAEDMQRIFPKSVRQRLDGPGRERLFEREIQRVREWAAPRLASDRLVPLALSADRSDPHAHAEDVYSLMSLAPDRTGLRVLTEGVVRPASDADWELASVSPRGTYRACYDLSGVYGLVIERVADGRLGALVTDQPMAQMHPAVWKDDTTLVVDRIDVATDPLRSVTHVEIDARGSALLRAIPLGPLGFGAPIPGSER